MQQGAQHWQLTWCFWDLCHAGAGLMTHTTLHAELQLCLFGVRMTGPNDKTAPTQKCAMRFQ